MADRQEFLNQDPELPGGNDAEMNFNGEGDNVRTVAELLQGDIELTSEVVQQIIMERRAERKSIAEEKRLEGLKRIAEMKSKYGVHPVNDLLLEEVWTQIIRNKDLEPEDRSNMCKVHPIFDKVMDCYKIPEILFPWILENEIPFLERSSFTSHKFRVEQFTSLRLVSKPIKDAFDKWIEKDLLRCMKDLRDHPRFEPVVLRFNKANLAGRITNLPRKIFSRSLDIHFHFNEEMNNPDDEVERREHGQGCARHFADFMNMITGFLANAGDQIHFLHLWFQFPEELDTTSFQNSAIYNCVRDIILLTPNLKWLQLRDYSDYKEFGMVRPGDEPQPRLSKLERFDWTTESEMCNAIIVANPQIKYTRRRLSHLSPTILRLPLEAVELGFGIPTGNLEMFEVPSQLRWNLKKTTLHINQVALWAVFECLQENFPTLEDLSLFYPKTSIEDIGYLRLPNLKKFELKFHHHLEFHENLRFFFELHFLLYCGKLESVKWCGGTVERHWQGIQGALRDSRHGRLVDFAGEADQELDWNNSNIWELFPNLRVINFLVHGQGKYLHKYRP